MGGGDHSDHGDAPSPFILELRADRLFSSVPQETEALVQAAAKLKLDHSTDTRPNSVNPIWRPWTYDLVLPTAADARHNCQYLAIEVLDKDLLKDEFLGQAIVPVSQFLQFREQKAGCSYTTELRSSRVKSRSISEDSKAAPATPTSAKTARKALLAGSVTFEYHLTGELHDTGLNPPTVSTLLGGTTASLSLDRPDLYFIPKVPAVRAPLTTQHSVCNALTFLVGCRSLGHS
jgi:hypothetical protein